MLLEFAAFIKLRIKRPDLSRPYRVPLQTFGATMLCLPPALLLILVMCLASARTYFVSGLLIMIGMLLYPAVIYTKDRKWIRFSTDERAHPEDGDIDDEAMMFEGHRVIADEAVSLLSSSTPPGTDKASETPSEGVLKLE